MYIHRLPYIINAHVFEHLFKHRYGDNFMLYFIYFSIITCIFVYEIATIVVRDSFLFWSWLHLTTCSNVSLSYFPTLPLSHSPLTVDIGSIQGKYVGIYPTTSLLAPQESRRMDDI